MAALNGAAPPDCPVQSPWLEGGRSTTSGAPPKNATPRLAVPAARDGSVSFRPRRDRGDATIWVAHQGAAGEGVDCKKSLRTDSIKTDPTNSGRADWPYALLVIVVEVIGAPDQACPRRDRPW
jgi:hypothetical protein